MQKKVLVKKFRIQRREVEFESLINTDTENRYTDTVEIEDFKIPNGYLP